MENQDLDFKIEILKKIYKLYDESISGIDSMCKKGCASCCTCNVTLTSLEAGYLMKSLNHAAKDRLMENIESHFSQKRYIPKITTNQFARLCMEGKEIPEEENDPSWGICPALKKDLCTIYEGRPIGCRVMMSQADCTKKGYAQVPPVVVTINNIFMQAIEQVDQKGISGNFSDVMPLFLSRGFSEFLSGDFGDNQQTLMAKQKGGNFLLNEKISVLMVPPEHRKQLSPLLEGLSSLLQS